MSEIYMDSNTARNAVAIITLLHTTDENDPIRREALAAISEDSSPESLLVCLGEMFLGLVEACVEDGMLVESGQYLRALGSTVPEVEHPAA